jgi:hypothetical protein
MVAVRDQELTDARRQDVRLEAAAVNSFLPRGYDRDAEMQAKGFLKVVHETCLRFSDETPPEGVVGIPKNVSREEEAAQRGLTVTVVQALRKEAFLAAVGAISEECKKNARWLYSQLGYPADLVFLFHPDTSMTVDVLKGVLGLPGSAKLRRDVAEGVCKKIAGSDPEAWHNAQDVRRMVSIMEKIAPATPFTHPPAPTSSANGRLRVAKVFMLLSRQKDVCGKKSGAAELGLLPLWCNYVECVCNDQAWIGTPYAWNPSLLAAGKHSIVYAALTSGTWQPGPASALPKRAAAPSDEGRPEKRLRGVELEAPSSSSAAPPPPAVPAQAEEPSGGRNTPWSKKYAYFAKHLQEKYPDFKLDDTFSEEAWPELAKNGKDSKITGSCRRCGAPNGGSISNIMGKQGLAKCKTSACRTVVVEAAAVPIEVDAEEEEQVTPRPKLNHNSNYDEIVEFFKIHHPSVRLAAKLSTRVGWDESIVSQTSMIEVTCTLCNRVCQCSSQNILFNGQGFCRPCKVLARGWEDAARVYRHAAAVISNPHMAQEGSGQRHLHVDVECLNADCGWKGKQSVRYHKLLHKKNPAAIISPCKRCNQVVPWKGEAGYKNILSVLERFKETRFYKMVLDLPQWVELVQNLNTKIPICCALCDEVREVRISSIQQGGSVGCGCLRSSVAFEAELRKLLRGADVTSEVKVKQTTGTFDFAVLIEEDADAHRSAYLRVCHELDLQPAATTPRIVFELDGRQHFSLIIYGDRNEEIGKRDLFKDLYACKENITVVRMQQASVWQEGSQWKEYLKSAVMYALSNPGGRVVCEDAPNYIETSEYVRFREGTALSEVTRDAALQYGAIREYHPEKPAQ